MTIVRTLFVAFVFPLGVVGIYYIASDRFAFHFDPGVAVGLGSAVLVLVLAVLEIFRRRENDRLEQELADESLTDEQVEQE